MGKRTLWLLVGSEEGSGNAENSGMLLLTKTSGGYHYAIADGNNILRIKGTVSTDEIETIPDVYYVEKDYKQEYGAVLTAVKKEEISKTEYADLLEEGEKAKNEFYDLVNTAGKYLALYNPGHKKDDDRYVVVKADNNKVMGTFEDSGVAYDEMVYLNKKEATFFKQIDERTSRYTDVWVIGASICDVTAMAKKLAEGDEYLFTDGQAEKGALTFRTEYPYLYAAKEISKALPGAIVFTMDSWEGFGFAAYKDGKKFYDYITNFEMEAMSDLEGLDELTYAGNITVCKKRRRKRTILDERDTVTGQIYRGPHHGKRKVV